MENVWFVAAIWVGLALVATLIAIWFKLSTALSEIVVGTVAQLVIGTFVAVMLELGLNRTDYGKAILAACFVNDLGTVIALGLIFSPFTSKTLIVVETSVIVFGALPFITPWFFRRYGGRVSELEAKFILPAPFAWAA